MEVKIRLHHEGIGLQPPIKTELSFENAEEDIIAAVAGATGHPYDGAVVTSSTEGEQDNVVRYCVFRYGEDGRISSLKFTD